MSEPNYEEMKASLQSAQYEILTLREKLNSESEARKLMGVDALRSFIKTAEADHFRTTSDTGSNFHAMVILNVARVTAGLPTLTVNDLPRWNGVDKYVIPAQSNLLAEFRDQAYVYESH
ncbi:MAG: hypothetical protein EOO52_13045 [Gammaproteobacteria bacterium]|nr:MAG: hypothetical protein EOO52_13045 [Gammaproteobacteria bacterium]